MPGCSSYPPVESRKFVLFMEATGVASEHICGIILTSDQIEFLLSSPSGPTARLDQDVVLSAEVRKEIGAMRHCLCEEEGLSPLSSPTPELSPLSSQVSLNLAIAEEIVSAQWMEIPQPPPASGDSSTFKVTLDRHSYDSAGLSPDCQAAYFLSERRVVVISLPADMNGGQPEGRSSWTLFPSVFRKDSPKPFHSLLQRKSSKPDPEYAGAAISERFLALFTQSTLQLYLYRRQTSSRQDGWATSLEVGWYATCIALYEEDNRAWVAIGRRGDSRAGSIKMYQIDIDNDNVTVKPHTARFDQSNPNPLRREYPKTVAFGPDGRRLVCVTSNDNVLAWLLSNNARPRRDPFVIQKTFRRVSRCTSFCVWLRCLFMQSLLKQMTYLADQRPWSNIGHSVSLTL